MKKRIVRTGDKPFFIRKAEDFAALEAWLKGREFNCGGVCGTDRSGNPMVGLSYDTDPDNDWKFPKKAGLIIVLDKSLVPQVEATIERFMQ